MVNVIRGVIVSETPTGIMALERLWAIEKAVDDLQRESDRVEASLRLLGVQVVCPSCHQVVAPPIPGDAFCDCGEPLITQEA